MESITTIGNKVLLIDAEETDAYYQVYFRNFRFTRRTDQMGHVHHVDPHPPYEVLCRIRIVQIQQRRKPVSCASSCRLYGPTHPAT